MDKQAEIDKIMREYAAKNREIEKDNFKNMARIGLGSVLSGASAHPVFNIPYIGTGIGGAMYDLGQGIVEGDKINDLVKRAARGFAIGETAGAIPYVGKFAGKTKAGQAIGEAVEKAGEKFAQSKAYDVLMTDIKAFNPNKQTVYHGSPADFNKFSNEAIGTGEGAQAHGVGHYAAKNKDVAEGYADRLSSNLYSNSSKIENTPLKSLTDDTKTSLQIDGRDITEARLKNDLSYYKNKLQDMEIKGTYIPEVNQKYTQKIQEFQNDLNLLNNFDESILTSDKQLYKLSIPKDDVMLREGATFAQQPKKVQEAIKSIVKEDPELAEVIDTRTAEEFFEIAQNKLGKKGKNIMKEVFDAELSGDENKIINAWDKYNELESKNPNITRTDFDPNEIYGYLRNYSNNGVDETGQLFQNQYSNTNLYKYLEDERNFNKRLYDKGIKGISYNGGIDGEARVIFNPDDIEIVRKYYNQPSLKDLYSKFINAGAYTSAATNP